MTLTEVEPGKAPFANGGWHPKYIGVPAPRLEDDRLLAGRGKYVADVRLPGMVEACFVRSQIAHGRILEIDTAKASGAAGVLAVATAMQLDGVSPVPHFYAIAKPVETLRSVGGSYTVQRQAPMPLETRGVVADFSDARLTVWSCTQFPHFLRTMLSHVLGLPEGSIRVIAPDIGGGFGGKAEIYPEEYVVPWLACRLRRPVRWIEDRYEHLIAACHARDVQIDIEAAVHEDGSIEAVRGRS